MRHSIRLLLILFAVCVCCPAVHAADDPARSIAVSGRATIKTQADRFIISGTITGTAAQAIGEAEAHAQRDLDALSRLIAPAQLMVLSRSSQRLTERTPAGAVTSAGYSSTIAFQLTVAELEQCRTLYRQVLTIGSAEISDLAYQSTQQVALREQARDQALLAARAKAAHMAGVLDTKLGPVAHISESTASWNMLANNARIAAAPADEAGAAYREGELEIAVTVDVVFALQ